MCPRTVNPHKRAKQVVKPRPKRPNAKQEEASPFPYLSPSLSTLTQSPLLFKAHTIIIPSCNNRICKVVQTISRAISSLSLSSRLSLSRSSLPSLAQLHFYGILQAVQVSGLIGGLKREGKCERKNMIKFLTFMAFNIPSISLELLSFSIYILIKFIICIYFLGISFSLSIYKIIIP